MYPEAILPIAAHIPHAGLLIPAPLLKQFLPHPSALWQEVAMVTDWYTDELFGLPGIAVSQTPINRVVVDLERYLDDAQEAKAAVGQGVIYTHNTLGERIRQELSAQERTALLQRYCHPWHLKHEINIEQQLARWGNCLLLDCHSFPDKPFPSEDDRGMPRPDICLGFSRSNTPEWLLRSCEQQFMQRGYSVAVDFPYTGCLVPQRYAGDSRVPAIMLEINRRLYLKPAVREACQYGNLAVRLVEFNRLKNDIWAVMLRLVEELVCRCG